jgi:hypothetical protein
VEFRLSLFLLVSAFFHLPCLAQDGWNWSVVVEGEQSKSLEFGGACNDSASCFEKLLGWRESQLRKGYLASSLDSVWLDGNHLQALAFRGNPIRQVEISGPAEESLNPDFMEVRDKWFSERTISFKRYNKFRSDLLRRLENNGFPFGGVGLELEDLSESSAKGKISIQLGPEILYDTLKVMGNHNVKLNFLEGMLNIEKGKRYSEVDLENVPEVIGGLSYVRLISGPDVRFLNNERAEVELILEKRKASAFDLIVGFLPNSSRNGGFLFTGLVTLDLVNPFGTGKEFYLQWSRLESQTQRLRVNTSFPYLFKTPLGFNAGLDMYKYDSLYLDLDWNLGLDFRFSGKSTIAAIVENHSTFVLNVDSTFFKGQGQFPEVQDIRNNHFGLRFTYSSLDFKPSPRRGVFLNIYGLAGFRKINRNDDIEKLVNPSTGETYGDLYDQIDLRSGRSEWGLKFDFFQPIKSRSVVYLGFEGQSLLAKDIFFNEKYRIGGTNSLRGFNEESLFTSFYGILDLEYRFLFSQGSYFSGFFNQGVVEAQDQSGDTWFPFGFGAGINLETTAGLFSLSYAVGKQQNQSIDFRTAKIHFGYLNRF